MFRQNVFDGIGESIERFVGALAAQHQLVGLTEKQLDARDEFPAAHVRDVGAIVLVKVWRRLGRNAELRRDELRGF